MDTVGPKPIGQAFSFRGNTDAKEGNTYVEANVSSVQSGGEKLIHGETDNGVKVKMPTQLADLKEANKLARDLQAAADL